MFEFKQLCRGFDTKLVLCKYFSPYLYTLYILFIVLKPDSTINNLYLIMFTYVLSKYSVLPVDF